MKRRGFITLLSGVAIWPFAARAQQQARHVIGFLHSGSANAYAHLVTAFREGLKADGFVEAQNLSIEFRWADGQNDRLPALAADLVRRQVAVIAATGGPLPVLAAKVATPTVPIVFSTGADPVKLGLVASMNQPGGNVTGVYVFTTVLDAKRLGLLSELLPAAKSIAALINPRNPTAESQSKDIRDAARAIGQQVDVLNASVDNQIDTAFATMAKLRKAALIVSADPFFVDRRERIVALAARHAIPAIYEQREFATTGGLVSYGTSLADAYRQVGIYVGKILKGAKPADLPVTQSTKFELVINLKSAKALGITVPPTLLARADEVIE